MTATVPSAAALGDRLHVLVRPSATTTRHRLEQDVLTGLTQSPPSLPPRWFYDERGSQLFDEITRLPEYYPTRRETEILTTHAGEIADKTAATTLVELGSGFSTKTELLLDALTRDGAAVLFVPIDVSEEALTAGARRVVDRYPSVTAGVVVADFSDALPSLPGKPGTRLVAFLGGTIGNFDVSTRGEFLSSVRSALAPGDHLLLGADLVKDADRLVAAYDDSRGVTAQFNLNLIDVLRRELDAQGLDSRDFEHVARWNARESRIEMWLRARRDVAVTFPTIDFDWQLASGDALLTEISVKFRRDALRDELEAHGFGVTESWTDDCGDFSLTLGRAW